MKRIFFTLAISFFGLTCSCQHSRVQHDDTVVKNPDSLSLHDRVLNDRELNPNGSMFYAERAKDTYVENVGQVATYRFIARKFPPNSKYLLCSQNLGCPIQPAAWYEADDDGKLGRQIDVGTLMLDQEMILMFDYFKGEPVDYWVCSADGKARLGSTFVPYPISYHAQDDAVISLRRLTPDASLVLLEGTDFNPDENILVSSQSGTLRTSNVPIVCAYGRFSMIFEPMAPGRSGGTAYIDVMRSSERLMLEYDWGCEAVNPKKRQGNTSKIKHDALLKIPTDIK